MYFHATGNFVNKNGTAEKDGINQINPTNIECIFVLVSYKLIKPISADLNVQKLPDNAYNDDHLSALKHA